MTIFEEALKFVLQYEGGYSNNPKDPGGSTFKGITQNTYNSYRVAKKLSKQDVRKLEDQELKDIYYSYWVHSGAKDVEQTRPGLALLLFDMGVNAGNNRALSFFKGVDQSLGDYTNRRIQYYTSLPTWEYFGKGWVRRIAAANLRASELETNLLTQERHRVYLHNVDITNLKTNRLGIVVNDTIPGKTYIRIEDSLIKLLSKSKNPNTQDTNAISKVEQSTKIASIPREDNLLHNSVMNPIKNVGTIINILFLVVAIVGELRDQTEMLEQEDKIVELVREIVSSFLGIVPGFLTDDMIKALLHTAIPWIKELLNREK